MASCACSTDSGSLAGNACILAAASTVQAKAIHEQGHFQVTCASPVLDTPSLVHDGYTVQLESADMQLLRTLNADLYCD